MAVRAPKIAVFADSTDVSMPVLDLAKAVEERGFSGIFLNEHTHQPVEHERSPWPDGGEIPGRYARFWDPYITLSFIAAQTSLEIGPCVSLIGEHDPIALAKAIATLDVLSNGRLQLGIGYGWHREEFEDHGFPARRRAFVVGDKLALMKQLWTKEVAEYEGEYVRLPPTRAWPKPLQKPHPPILMGTPGNQRNFARIAKWADGWIPMRTPIFDEDFPDLLSQLDAEWELNQRDGRPRITIMMYYLPVEQLGRAYERCAELGVERMLVQVPDEDSDASLRRLDDAAKALARYL